MITGERLELRWVITGVIVLLAAAVAGLTIGQSSIAAVDALKEVADRLPLVSVDSGLTDIQKNIVWEVRVPRVLLGGMVGASLAVAGGGYQAVFRNPLADPFLLGAAAGAGVGATVAIAYGIGDGVGGLDPVPMLAFIGAMFAVLLSWVVGSAAQQRSAASLLLAGVAVASFLTAVQTFILQRNAEVIRQVYTWLLGRLTTATWDEVRLIAPYFIVSSVIVIGLRRVLDVMRVGDAEATSLGIRPGVVRGVVVVAASLGTAAAVAVSGLIAFVGLIGPHTIRLLVGASNRVVLPLALLFGAAFLIGADVVARNAVDQGEVPIGVITAFCGAPFFLMVLRTSRRLVA